MSCQWPNAFDRTHNNTHAFFIPFFSWKPRPRNVQISYKAKSTLRCTVVLSAFGNRKNLRRTQSVDTYTTL